MHWDVRVFRRVKRRSVFHLFFGEFIHLIFVLVGEALHARVGGFTIESCLLIARIRALNAFPR